MKAAQIEIGGRWFPLGAMGHYWWTFFNLPVDGSRLRVRMDNGQLCTFRRRERAADD